MRKLISAAMAAMMVAGAASADNFGASVNYGLGGFGVDLGYSLIPDILNVRAGLNAGLSMSGSITPDTTTYNYDLKTGYKTLGLDWHPFSGAFRVGAGFVWSDIKLDVISTGSYVLNGVQGSGSIIGQVTYDNAPYVSIGWSSHAPSSGGFFFNSELGVMLSGKPSVTLTTDNATFNSTNAAAIDVERNKVRDNALGWFPIVKLGVGYSF